MSLTNENYASWNVDSSYNRGFFHINFTNPNLHAAAASLRPSTMRFGGSGNDYLTYLRCSSANDSDAFGCLNASHLADLHGMAEAAGADFLFGVSFHMLAACAASTSYRWSPDNVVELVKHLQERGMGIWGFELGTVSALHFLRTRCDAVLCWWCEFFCVPCAQATK